MPELPEVETIRRVIAPAIEGRQIVDSWSHTSPKFIGALGALGRTVGSVGRRGKYLIADLDDGRELIIHLGMTGSLRTVGPEPRSAARSGEGRSGGAPDDIDPYVRAWWVLSDGSRLVFRDVRRFGRIAVVPAGDYASLPTLANLGPEPFDDEFDAPHLWSALRTGTRHVKTKLLSQEPVAGLGNIYADEAMWLAGIDPADRRVTRPGSQRLVIAIRQALTSGLDHGGTTLRDYVDADGRTGSNQHHLHCYGRAGLPCERCATPLRKRNLDGRTTTWCPRCQPRRG